MAKAKTGEGAKKAVKKATTKAKAAAPAEKKAAKPAAEKKAPVKQTTVKKTTTKTAAAKKETVRKSVPQATGSMPMIDTNLAAESAAKMLLARPEEAATGGQAPAPAEKESSTFKNMKEQLAKPKPAGLGNLFGPTGGEKKFGNQGFSNQQKGHNQTFGGINKAGVPRRTNG
jgi:RNA polymerase primary sigma factor